MGFTKGRVLALVSVAVVLVLVVLPQPADADCTLYVVRGGVPLRSGQVLTKLIGRTVRRSWRARREAAKNGTAPQGWFERAVDWLDGTLSKVPVGRNNNPDFKESGRESGGGAGGSGGGDVWDEGTTAVDGGASWESLTTVGGGGASTSSDGSSGGGGDVDDVGTWTNLDAAAGAAFEGENENDNVVTKETSSSTLTGSRAKKRTREPKSRESTTVKASLDPLADRNRKPDYVFTLGGGEIGGDHHDLTRQVDPAWAAHAIRDRHVDDARGGERSGRVGTGTVATDTDTDTDTSKRTTAYQREKRSGRIGDEVTRLTQEEAASQAKARTKAETAKKEAPKGTGTVTDVHTEITVLYAETFDDATALARRHTDGVGLDRAGGLGEASRDIGNKRRWLIAFCTRWATPCNLLVREFALLGSDPTLREFALGWVDCTPAKMTAFCGGRFAAAGYPMIVLVTGGRMVRYSAMKRERIAGAIAPWAVATAAEVDAFAPNQGPNSAPAPGTTVPPPTATPAVPDAGSRGTRAFSESEHEALARQSDKQRKRHEMEEEKRLAEEAKRRKREGADKGTSGKGEKGGGTTTAPKMSTRRAARLSAVEKNRGKGEL